MVVLDDNNFKSEVEDSKGLVFVDFYADWCGPCKMMSPIVDELAEESDIKVVKVDVDNAIEVSKKYGIMSIPTFIVFKDGKEYKKHIGMCDKNALLELIK